MINQERMEKALRYLAETDAEEAALYERSLRFDERRKQIFAVQKGYAKGSVAEREAAAYDSDEYRGATEAYFAALEEHRAMKNKRATESMVIEVWRSENASRRKGNVI